MVVAVSLGGLRPGEQRGILNRSVDIVADFRPGAVGLRRGAHGGRRGRGTGAPQCLQQPVVGY